MDRQFAPWVAPIAAELRETRVEIARVAGQLPRERWEQASPLEGWNYKDLLAHLATGDWLVQTVLGAVTSNQPVDLAVIDLDYVNAGNARLLADRAGRPVDELIDEAEAEGEDTQALLAKLTDADDGRTQEGAPMSLGGYLRMFPGHDRGHLAQLRTALEASA